MGVAAAGEGALGLLVELVLPLPDQAAIDAELAPGLGVAVGLGEADGLAFELLGVGSSLSHGSCVVVDGEGSA